jgi:hypothetical protein
VAAEGAIADGTWLIFSRPAPSQGGVGTLLWQACPIDEAARSQRRGTTIGQGGSLLRAKRVAWSRSQAYRRRDKTRAIGKNSQARR